MKRLLCSMLPRPGVPTRLADTEAKHALQVLRLRTGDSVIALDALGGLVKASLRVSGSDVWLEYAEKIQPTADTLPLPLTLELGILKGEAMEWIVEKAVELNASRLIPLITEHTVVQIGRKGPEAFRERWQRIADQALKQCGRLKRMTVEAPLRLDHHLSESSARQEMRLFCDEAQRANAPHLMSWLQENWTDQPIRLLIGPEGGWSPGERQLILSTEKSAMETVSLGPWVLRAETAALFGMSLATGHLTAGVTKRER